MRYRYKTRDDPDYARVSQRRMEFRWAGSTVYRTTRGSMLSRFRRDDDA